MDRWGEWMCQQVDMAHQFRVQQMLRPARREAGPTLQIHEARHVGIRTLARRHNLTHEDFQAAKPAVGPCAMIHRDTYDVFLDEQVARQQRVSPASALSESESVNGFSRRIGRTPRPSKPKSGTMSKRRFAEFEMVKEMLISLFYGQHTQGFGMANGCREEYQMVSLLRHLAMTTRLTRFSIKFRRLALRLSSS